MLRYDNVQRAVAELEAESHLAAVRPKDGVCGFCWCAHQGLNTTQADSHEWNFQRLEVRQLQITVSQHCDESQFRWFVTSTA